LSFWYSGEPEVTRVWLPNNDSPGLAMARAFGDFCLKDFGLISVPDVYYHRLTERDEFIILATDGVSFPSFIQLATLLENFLFLLGSFLVIWFIFLLAKCCIDMPWFFTAF